MRLSRPEFNAMNTSARRLVQRAVEFPLFKQLGLACEQRDVLEIGCGSGYGATLLATLRPRSYVGVDLMPEQIELARKRSLPNAEFMLRDATDLTCLPDGSRDVVVIFGVLHHIPPWRAVVRELQRVLRADGELFVEEPDGFFVERFDKLFKWGHAPQALFRLREFEAGLTATGFVIVRQLKIFGFGFYGARKTMTGRP